MAERMTEARRKWLREYLTPIEGIVPITIECLDEIDALRAELALCVKHAQHQNSRVEELCLQVRVLEEIPRKEES